MPYQLECIAHALVGLMPKSSPLLLRLQEPYTVYGELAARLVTAYVEAVH